MKKLALLFGALSLVSSVAYAKEVVPVVEEVVVVEEAPVYTMAAAPALKVTNIGQSLEIDNTSGKENIGEEVHFANTVGLAYEDWTFELMARKTWSMDTRSEKADKPDQPHGTHSVGHRIDMTAMRHFDNYALGLKWRQDEGYDRYYVKGAYNYEMFSGEMDLAYQSNNDGNDNDNWYLEAVPVQLSYGPMFVNYHIEGSQFINPKEGEVKREVEHQVRLGASYAVTDKLGLSAEYRYQFKADKDYKGQGKPWLENNKHIAILGADYALTEALSINGYYEYDFNRYDRHNDPAKTLNDDKNYYGEFCIGWNYSF